jgi:flagellar biosynthesis protein FlhG
LQRAPRPLLLAAEHPDSLTHAYAAMKLLALRNRQRQFDLLLAAPPQSRRAAAIAQRLASCAQSFLGASLHAWAAIDPACDVREAPADALVDLVAAQLGSDEQDAVPLPTLN